MHEHIDTAPSSPVPSVEEESPLDPLSDPFLVDSNGQEQTGENSDHEGSDSKEDGLGSGSAGEDVPGPKFEPTVPRAMSGSPTKPKAAPLDPEHPIPGMIFSTMEEAVHFAYEYGI